MATETRAQGRPPRGDGQFGRARLLERTRDALESRPKIDIARSEIAVSAGVTPALVSYYYRDKWDLFAAAAEPVITAYIADLREILHRSAPLPLKARSLVRLFISFNLRHGYLLDFCLYHRDKTGIKCLLKDLRSANLEVVELFDHMIRRGIVRGNSSTFIQASLWGLCKYVSQQYLIENTRKFPTEDGMSLIIEHVCDLFFDSMTSSEYKQDSSKSILAL